MLPYWLVFSMWLVGALQTERRRLQDPRVFFFAAAAMATALFIGLRLEVGGDWGPYTQMFETIYFLRLFDALGVTDPGYAAINWLSATLGFGIILVNLICAAIFTAGVSRLAWRQPNPALAMLVAVPYLIIVVAMGYTRQAAAIGLICLAIADISERRIVRLVVFVGLAALFHKTAVLILPLLLVPLMRRNIIAAVFGGIVFVGLFILVLRDNSDRLITNYVQSNYDSQGAAIRVAMNVVAAALFLVLRKRFDIPAFQKSFWTVCAILAILSVPALLSSSASSGIDRISLYLIPLQMIVYSRLPYALSRSNAALPSIVFAIIAYGATTQYVWLNYANNAQSWLPYRLSLNL